MAFQKNVFKLGEINVNFTSIYDKDMQPNRPSCVHFIPLNLFHLAGEALPHPIPTWQQQLSAYTPFHML